HQDPWVDHAARYTYDYNYDGAGNWPFNTAYAARFGLESFVTRLRSLTEAEQFIKAGIPLVVSVSFKESKLDGAGYGTNGHLMTIVGFEADGDVIVNDPASHLIPSNDEVRVVYDREQLENAWIGHTGGISYVIHPESVALPAAPAQANW
ncbi:MAG TPA: C39 family peptidase, partial [Nocardioidaceae bacterium]|nr:C39 family peptidase [Nocardioidaceae bacterium]